MRIDRVRVVRIPLQMVAPLRTSAGDHTSRTATLVEVTADDGTVGWGENVAPEGSFYTGETAEVSNRHLKEVVIPALASDRDDMDDDDLDEEDSALATMPMAAHAFTSALADIEARQRGVSLAKALGGTPGNVRVGVVVGLHDDIDSTVAECVARAAEGYTRVKIKIAPGNDVDVVREVRAALPPGVELHVDANGAYDPSEPGRLSFLDGFGVGLLEQPFAPAEMRAHAALARMISTPVCLDESVPDFAAAIEAISTGACSVINVKPSRVGGFHAAVAIMSLCAENGIGAWVGGMLESGIGRAGCLALATHPACTHTPDLSASDRYFLRDVTAPFVMTDGCIAVPRGPGLGVAPDPELLRDAATSIETVFGR